MINWPTIGVALFGIAVTILINIWIQSRQNARQQGQQEQRNKNFTASIKELADSDRDMATQISSLRKWGEEIIDERARYNENTYLRKDMFTECHRNLERKVDVMTAQVTKLNESDTPVRLAKIETSMDSMRVEITKVQATQDEILIALRGLK